MNNRAPLSSHQLSELGDAFHSLAQSVHDYRLNNRELLPAAENRKLKEFHLSLLDNADRYYTTAAKLVMNDVNVELKQIIGITKNINKDFQKLKSVQKAIDVAAAGVELSAAIFSKKPIAISEAISVLLDRWNQ